MSHPEQWLVFVTFDDEDAARDYAQAVKHAREVHMPALGTWQTYAANVVGDVQPDLPPPSHDARTVSDDDDEVESEFRVVRRRHGNTEWQTVVTQRGQGRPLRTSSAARGLITRETSASWNRRYEYKIQWRPVTTEWYDL